jgi:hypothetical protein
MDAAAEERFDRATRRRLAGQFSLSARGLRRIAQRYSGTDPLGAVVQCALHGWGQTLCRLGEIEWACRLQIAALGLRCRAYGPDDLFTRRTLGLLLETLMHAPDRRELLEAAAAWYDRQESDDAVESFERCGLLPDGDWPDVVAWLIGHAPVARQATPVSRAR